MPRLVYQRPSTSGRTQIRQNASVLEELLSNAAHRVGFFPSPSVHLPSGQKHIHISVDPVDDLCLTNQIYSALLHAFEFKEITEVQNAHLQMLLEDDET